MTKFIMVISAPEKEFLEQITPENLSKFSPLQVEFTIVQLQVSIVIYIGLLKFYFTSHILCDWQQNSVELEKILEEIAKVPLKNICLIPKFDDSEEFSLILKNPP